MLKIPVLVLCLAFLLPSCASDRNATDDVSETRQGDQGSDDGMNAIDPSDKIDFGSPGDPSAANIEVLIEAHDSLRFTPAIIEALPGDTVTFVVRNDGDEVHELVLGDEDYQAAHAVGMSEGHAMGLMSNKVTVKPGRRGTITWTFTKPGEVMFACHQPGHYEGGMVGTIQVGA